MTINNYRLQTRVQPPMVADTLWLAQFLGNSYQLLSYKLFKLTSYPSMLVHICSLVNQQLGSFSVAILTGTVKWGVTILHVTNSVLGYFSHHACNTGQKLQTNLLCPTRSHLLPCQSSTSQSQYLLFHTQHEEYSHPVHATYDFNMLESVYLYRSGGREFHLFRE